MPSVVARAPALFLPFPGVHGFNIVDKDRPVLYFDNLTEKEKKDFLDYELTVYFCTGDRKSVV